MAYLLALAFLVAAALVVKVIGDDLLTDEAAELAGISFHAHLYTNNHTPAAGDNVGMYTAATFTGSTAFASSGSPGAIVGDTVDIDYGSAVAQWISGGGAPPNDTVYGVYITDITDTKFYGAKLFAGGPYDMTVVGAVLTLTTYKETLTRL